MSDSILVTGVAGSGKSTVCRELRRRGYAAHDIENVTGLFVFVDKSTGKPVADYGYDNPEWFEQHDWICNKGKLEELVLANRPGLAFYCGIAANLDDLLPMFDMVFLLRVSAKVLRRRLSGRRADDFGRAPAIQEWLLGWKEGWEGKLRKKGAIATSADRDIGDVVDDIINTVTNYPHT